jgi:hypothetical protein
MKKLPQVGQRVCDMHDGHMQLTKDFKVLSFMQFEVSSAVALVFKTAIELIADVYYTNKLLYAIGEQTGKDSVICMYVYDLMFVGIIEIAELD